MSLYYVLKNISETQSLAFKSCNLIRVAYSSLHEKEENGSFAVGHLAFGYILGKLSAKSLKTKTSFPLLFALSIIPDIDILFKPFLEHRGPAHSIVVAFIVFVPAFVIYRKEAIPYFIAIIQHSLVGDYIGGGGIQLFWPLTSQYYGVSTNIGGSVNIKVEWAAFLTSIIIMLKSKDMVKFFQPHKSNLLLAIPTFAVLLPTVLSYPLEVPVSLIPPHLVYMLLFLAAIIITLNSLLGKSFHVRTCL